MAHGCRRRGSAGRLRITPTSSSPPASIGNRASPKRRRHGRYSAASASRGGAGRAGFRGCVVLDSRRMGLARQLGLVRRPLGPAAASGRSLGAWRLGLAPPSPCLGRRILAVRRPAGDILCRSFSAESQRDSIIQPSVGRQRPALGITVPLFRPTEEG